MDIDVAKLNGWKHKIEIDEALNVCINGICNRNESKT